MERFKSNKLQKYVHESDCFSRKFVSDDPISGPPSSCYDSTSALLDLNFNDAVLACLQEAPENGDCKNYGTNVTVAESCRRGIHLELRI